MVWRGRFSIRDGRSAASSIQGYEPAGPILDYALKPQIMAPGYLPEAFAINDSCKADGRKRRGPEQLSFIHQGEIARALSYLLDGMPHSASEISLATGIKITTVRAVLRKLARENSVQKTEKGNSPKQKYLLIKHSQFYGL